MADKALTKKVVDGYGLVEGTDEAFAVIDALRAKAADAAAALEKANGATDAATTAHDAALKERDDKIADLEKQIADTGDLDAKVEARAKLIGDARKIGGADLKLDGLSDADVRKTAVTAAMGEDKVKDKSASYFDGAFELLVDKAGETANDDAGNGGGDNRSGLRDALNSDTTQHRNDDRKGGESYEDRMSKRWKKEKAA